MLNSDPSFNLSGTPPTPEPKKPEKVASTPTPVIPPTPEEEQIKAEGELEQSLKGDSPVQEKPSTLPDVSSKASPSLPVTVLPDIAPPADSSLPPPTPPNTLSKDGKIILPQKAIRTYESDIAEVLAKSKVSVASIAIAENKKTTGVASIGDRKTSGQLGEAKEDYMDRYKPSYTKRILLVLGGLILIGAGAVGAYYLYLRSPFAAPQAIQQAITIPSIIAPDKQIFLSIDGISSEQIVSRIYSEFGQNPLPEKKILELILSETNQEIGLQQKNNNEPYVVTGSEFIKKIGLGMPNVILRSLTDRWMLGSYSEEDGRETPFIALTTNFFQNAFAGMLSWEGAMPEDMATLLNYRDRALAPDIFVVSTTTVEGISATTTATTTLQIPISSYFSIQGVWSDKEIHNRDVREFKNSSGELLFLYSFINKETFVFTTTESAFLGLLDRIDKQTYVR